MSPARRLCVVIVLGLVLVAAAVQAQRIVIGVGPAGQPPDTLATVTLPINRQAQQVMAKGQELIEEHEFAKACEALQFLLSLKEDSFVKVQRTGAGQKNEVLYVSIRSEANRLLGTMPAEGLKHYEQLYGREATARLAEARTANDAHIVAEVAQRYFHTEAGRQATELLATRLLERGEYLMAALYFERLLARPDAAQLGGLTLFKAALAFHRNGDPVNRDLAWKLLAARTQRDGGIRLGEQMVALEQLRTEIERAAPVESRGTHDWPSYRGTPERSGQAIAGKVDLGEVAWDMLTLYLPGISNHGGKGWTEELVSTGIKALDQQNQPILPAFHPVAVNGKVILSLYDGVYAADLRQKEQKLHWFVFTDGGVAVSLAPNSGSQQKIKEWWSGNQNQGYKTWGPQSILFENSVTGTPSTDGTRVFVIDELPLLPHPLLAQNNFAMMGFAAQPAPNSLEEKARYNGLKCYNLETGKIAFELGTTLRTGDTPQPPDRFTSSRFLSAPLSMSGKFYLLNEKAGSINLVCLEALDTVDVACPPRVIWDQRLADVKDGDTIDLNRRLHAAHITYGEGFLICPTNAGALVAVDLLTRSLVWAHHYREVTPPQPAAPPAGRRRVFNANAAGRLNLTSQWRHSAPAIAEGKVVFTAPDSADITCLNLRDGRRVWKHPRAADDLYFAGIYQGKVVVVGKNSVRAYKLTDGTKVWDASEVTGLPTGEGVAAGNVYHLPARNASHEFELVTIDLTTGKVTAHIKAEKMLGNLLFHDGYLVSQTASTITAFPVR